MCEYICVCESMCEYTCVCVCVNIYVSVREYV